MLVVLGLLERLADLIDVRKDDLGLALATEKMARAGGVRSRRSYGSKGLNLRMRKIVRTWWTATFYFSMSGRLIRTRQLFEMSYCRS
ncbi:hypothetical protein [Rhizobium leguminosarum]|uniref:hypothetical protein n=1 Tax=Rhizobium TaxID=379 RepID=UPI001FE0E1AF|nr:hypothetical protein [Rhizobium leguminosarum]